MKFMVRWSHFEKFLHFKSTNWVGYWWAGFATYHPHSPDPPPFLFSPFAIAAEFGLGFGLVIANSLLRHFGKSVEGHFAPG